MIRIDASLPEMSASSDVSPTVRELERTLVLAYHLPEDEACAVVRFDGVRDWHYGYPNDEGLDAHPSWGQGLEHYAFHVTPVARHGERAWVATFHDGTLTVYADSVEVLVRDRPGTPAAALEATLGRGEQRDLDRG